MKEVKPILLRLVALASVALVTDAFPPTRRPLSCSMPRMVPKSYLPCQHSSALPDWKSQLWMAESSEDETPVESEMDKDLVDAKIEPEELTRLQRLRRRVFPPKEDDGLTFRQKLAKAGLSVALSYGWVSNVSYAVTVSLAWYIFSKRSGMSPLAPGQWKGFLAVYAGFYVFNNVVRPVRFALSVSVSMYFERVVSNIQTRFKVSKGVAIGLTVFLANVVGTIALMCLGISIAAGAAGVPVFAK